MFPNVRLQIVALFVSVVALSFGFGVFAAFRVNHEPLAQIPASAAPLPLEAENAELSRTATPWGAPFGSRFWLSETQIRGAADLPALSPVVRHDVTGRTISWIVVTGSVVGAPAPQPPPALSDARSVSDERPVEALPPPMQGAATQEVAAPAPAPAPLEEAAAPAQEAGAPAQAVEPAAVPATAVGAAEAAAQVQPEVTNTVPEDAAQELKALPKIPAHVSHTTAPRRRVAARAPIMPQTGVQSAVQQEHPVVFQTAPPPYRPQNGPPVVARSASQNPASDVPIFQTAPASQR
jgi:hypothetical protein